MIGKAFRKLYFGPFMRPWRWPDDVDRTRWTPITIPRGRTHLVGLLGAADHRDLGSVVRKPALGTVVLAHPASVAAKGFWLRRGHAELFRKLGYDVIVFDFNGWGESPPVAIDFPTDLVAVGRYAKARAPELPVVGVGTSFGAGHLLCTLALPEHSYDVVVAEAPWYSLPNYWRPYLPQYVVTKLSQVFYPRMERRQRPIRAMGRLRNSPHVLLVHGDLDEVAAPKISRKLLAAARGAARAELWDVPHAGHNDALKASPAAYAERVGGFLSQALRVK